MSRRDAMLEALKRETPFDLLVIGGGITGSGAARDAARRGLASIRSEMVRAWRA